MNSDLKESKPSFLQKFLQNLPFIDQHKVKMFEILDEIAARFPNIPYDLYLEQALFLIANVDRSFVEFRDVDFFCWLLKQLSKKTPGKLHTHLHPVAFPFHTKNTLGFLLQFHGIEEEIDSVKEAVLKENRTILPVEGASFCLRNQKEDLSIFYFELQKKKGEFSSKEIAKLRSNISKLMQSTASKHHYEPLISGSQEFLSKTLCWTMKELESGDGPQVLIHYNKRTSQKFIFSAAVCQVLEGARRSLEEILDHSQIEVESLKIEKEGIVREGALLKLEIPSLLSIAKARNEVARLLRALVGPFRDMNGGLLEKIEENFQSLKQETNIPTKLLQEFFYSITPEGCQATAPPFLLKLMYSEMEKHVENDLQHHHTVISDDRMICITVKMPHGDFEKVWKKALSKISHLHFFASIHQSSHVILGCAFLNPTPEEAENLKRSSLLAYEKWCARKEIKQVLNLCATYKFSSFDPRIGVEENNSYLCKMLFEGLMKIGPEGTVEPAIAKKVEISNDKKQYRFFLRKSYWSNGLPLTAHDFVYSWRTTLTPNFFSTLTYLFYGIKNAKEVKKGKLSPDSLGVQAINDYILEVTLCHLEPHFLEFCTLSVFFPICQKVDRTNPYWPKGSAKDYVCNGPFMFEHNKANQKIVLKKNPHFWESDRVHLEKVNIPFVTEKEAVQLFKDKKTDALMNAFCLNLPSLDQKSSISTTLSPLIKTHYLYLNCARPPFHNRKIRLALSLALCREEIAKSVHNKAVSHYSPYPPVFSQKRSVCLTENLTVAKRLLAEALKEDLNLKNDIYEQTIYASRSHKKLAQNLVQAINKALGFKWKMICAQNTYAELIKDIRNLNISISGWVNRVGTPGYFLDIFSSLDNDGNLSQWTNDELQTLIQGIKEAPNLEERQDLYHRGEKLLLEEMPIIPLLYTTHPSLCHHYIQGMSNGSFQQCDIRYAFKC